MRVCYPNCKVLLDHHYVIEYEDYYLSVVLDPTHLVRLANEKAAQQEVKPEVPVIELALHNAVA